MTTTTTTMDEAALYRLMTWLSPSFPVGAYTYSHGLEWAVEEGLLRNRDDLVAWVAGLLRHGTARGDADLFREAHAAVLANDPDALRRVAAWGDALRGAAELALESSAQGRAFRDALAACWPAESLPRWLAVLDEPGRPPAYAVAVAVAAAAHGVAVRPALAAFLHAFVANLVSAAVRLVPLGQTDGQRAQAALAPVVAEAVGAALARTWDDLGGAAPLTDLCSMAHETQYTRLFRS